MCLDVVAKWEKGQQSRQETLIRNKFTLNVFHDYQETVY